MRLFLSYFLLSTFFTYSNASTTTELETGSYRGLYGTRNYKVYVPKSRKNKELLPVVVMLHGCQQNAEEFARGSRITKWAEKEKFIVLLPEQNIAYNPFKCWNWIIPGNNSRYGESEVIVTMLDDVLKKYNGNKDKVFAAGMSAGASMVNILGNCYPERFRGLGSHDGSQFYSSYLGLDFAEVVLNGASVPASVSGRVGYACSNGIKNRPKKMPIIIFHGMRSPLMSPMHAFQIESEFKVLNDFLDNGLRDNSYFLDKNVENFPETEKYGYNKYSIIDQEQEVLIERYMINDLAHGWSGGAPNLPYNDPKGPDATGLIIKFFKANGL